MAKATEGGRDRGFRASAKSRLAPSCVGTVVKQGVSTVLSADRWRQPPSVVRLLHSAV